MHSTGDKVRRATITAQVTCLVAAVFACAACAGRTVEPPPTPPVRDRCGELTSAQIYVSLHRARHTGGVDAATVDCLRSLPAAPDDLDERLAFLTDGERGTLGAVRHGLAVRDGSLQIHLAALEREAPRMQDAGLWLELGELLERVGRDREAMAALDAAAALAPDDAQVASARVRLGTALGRADAQLDAIAFADTLPDTAMTWSLRTTRARPDGLARFALHARTVAVATSRATRDPDSDAARLRLVDLLADDVHRWADAAAWLAGAEVPGVRLRVADARLRWRMGDRDGALERARSLTTALPHDPAIVELQAGFARAMGLRDEASRADTVRTGLLRERAERLSDDPGAQLALALASLRTAGVDGDEALSAAAHAARLAPGLADAHLVAGHLARAHGRQADATASFETLDGLLAERAREADSDAPRVRLALHRIDALDAPQRALDALDGTDPEDAAVQQARCRALEQAGEVEAAIAACEEAVRRAPGWLAPRVRLVELERQRQPGSELEALRAVLALDPEQSLARRRLVELLLTGDDAAEAARVQVEPLRWSGPGADAVDRALRRLAHGEMPVLADLMRRWALTPWLSQSPEHWSMLAEGAIAREAWSRASYAASRVAELGGGARALVTVSAAALTAGQPRVGLQAVELAVAAEPEARGEMFRTLAEAARLAGWQVLGDWASCRLREGASCGRPPTSGGRPFKP